MENIKKIVCGILTIVMACGVMTACHNNPSAEDTQKQQTNQALDQMNKQLGMPAVKNFQEKKMLKHIYELRDKSNLICYWYTVNQMDGKLVYQGKCIGYGLPYSTEYTNPEKTTYSGETGLATLPQADPNGLYAPSSADATWIDAVDDNGNEHIQYVEPNIIVSENKKDKRLCEAWSLPANY